MPDGKVNMTGTVPRVNGKPAVFLVDTSGRMDLIDENTRAPSKWPGVRDTLTQMMKSLPELEQFQIVTYSEDAGFPLGKEGEWIGYDPKTAPEKARAALTRIKPSEALTCTMASTSPFGCARPGSTPAACSLTVCPLTVRV